MQNRMNVRNMAFAERQLSASVVPKKAPKGAYVMIGETAKQQQRTIALSCQDPSPRFGAQIN